MKLLGERDSFKKLITVAEKATAAKTTMPILECLLIVGENDGARVIGNDLEMGIETKADSSIQVIEKGAVALEAKLFSEIIGRLPNGEVFIDVDERNVTSIKCGKTEFKIVGFSGGEFPYPEKIEKNNEVNISAAEFKNMIKQTVFSVATDESKITMTGELFEIKDDKLRLVAIDGFRIAMREIKTESICTEQIKKIVPGKTLKEMIKILPSEKEEIIGLYFNDKTMMLETAEFTLVSRLLDGEFMNYEGIINAEYNTVATVSRPDFLTSIARCTIISGKDTKKPPIKLNIGESRVAVSSQTEFGNCYDEIAAEITGAELEMGFNPRYLADALSAIDEDFVSLRLNTPLSPCMIVSEENSAFVYLVLPLRLK